MQKIYLIYLFCASGIIQFFFLAVHLFNLRSAQAKPLFIESLPILYLAATYALWLLVATFISWRTKKYRVPLLMHIPHLFSFLPLIRHIMLAADKQSVDLTGLTFAWLHAVATHTFSLVAAWLWQMRPREDTRWRSVFMRHRVSILLYLLAQLTIVLIYAGLDFRFANTAMPWAVGLLQLLLNMAVTALILYNHFGKLRLLRFATALTFSIVNFVLLFDSSFNAFISAEAALAASSFTQIFTLFVFLVYAEEQSEIA